MNPFTIILAKQTGFKCPGHLDRLTFGNLSIDVALHMNKVGPYTFSLSHRASSQSVIMCYHSLVLLTHCTYNFNFSRNLYNGDCWLWIIQFSFTGYFVFCLSIWKSSTWVENVLSSFFELKWKAESQSYYSACLFWNHHVFCPQKIERQLWYVFVILLNRLCRSRFMKSTQRLTFYQSWIIYFLNTVCWLFTWFCNSINDKQEWYKTLQCSAFDLFHCCLCICADNSQKEPAFYAGYFTVDETSQLKDTYISFRGWGKGIASVNDFNIGRYWPVRY